MQYVALQKFGKYNLHVFKFKLLLSGLLFCSVSLLADKGTSQEHLISVAPSVSQTEVNPNTQVMITFDRQIDENRFKNNAFTLKDKNKKVSGQTILSDDKRSIMFTPNTPMLMETHSVKLLPLKLQGSEEQPCKTFYNRVKAYFCEKLNWFCDDICYEDAPIMSKLIKYSFSVADNAANVVALQIVTSSRDLNESQNVPVTVTALLDDNTTQEVTDKVSWESSSSSIAEVKNNMIIAKNEGSTKLSATYNDAITATLAINVYKTVDGYRLPHEVDESVNNSTLLGIDANNNGIRDDVERWIHLDMKIYNGYDKIERAIAMQGAKASQMALADPTNADDKVHKAITAYVDCWEYYSYSRNLPFNNGEIEFDIALDDKVFNTKERLKTYFQYDSTLSGGIFTATPTLQTKAQCETNIDEL